MPKADDLEARTEIIASHFREILETLGEDAREGIKDTPDRFARMYMNEIYNPNDPLEEELKTTFTEPSRAREMVVVGDIPLLSYCEHHTLPYFGYAWVGYVPNGEVLGLSKIARLVQAAARGLTIQERVTDRIASALDAKMHPYGVIVMTKCLHTCMVVRGIKAYTSKTTITALRGVYRDSDSAKNEFYSMIAERSGF